MNWLKDIDAFAKKEIKNKWVVGTIAVVALISSIVLMNYWMGGKQREQNALTDKMAKIEAAVENGITAQNPYLTLEEIISKQRMILSDNSEYTNLKTQYSELARERANPLYVLGLTILIVAISANAALLITLLLRYLYTLVKFDDKDSALAFYTATYKNIFYGLIIAFAILIYFYK